MDRSQIIASHEEEINAIVAQLAAADAARKQRAEQEARAGIVLEEARRRLTIDQQISAEEAAFSARLDALRSQRAGGDAAAYVTPPAPATPKKAAGGGGAAEAAAEAPGAPMKKKTKKQVRWQLFVAFVHEQIQKVHPRARYCEAMKAASARWEDGKPISSKDERAFAEWLTSLEEEVVVDAQAAVAAAGAGAGPASRSAVNSWRSDPLLPELIAQAQRQSKDVMSGTPGGSSATYMYLMHQETRELAKGKLAAFRGEPVRPSILHKLLEEAEFAVADACFDLNHDKVPNDAESYLPTTEQRRQYSQCELKKAELLLAALRAAATA